jgi:BASS family bile acid:Na+ symporter
MTLASLIPILVKASITISVFAIGLKATFPDATYLFRRPALLVRALLSMNVVMPLFALLLGLTFDLHPAVKIALVTLSVAPVPPILPRKALKAGGREEYTIGLLTASALLSIIFVPVTMEVFQAVTGISLQMTALEVALLVLTSVMAPLVLGIAVRSLWNSFAARAATPLNLFAMVLLILAVIPILFTSMRAILGLVGDGTLLALAAFALVGLVAGHLLGGPDPVDRPVLALATSSRHPAIALAIAHVNFPNQKLTGAVVVVYLVVSMILAAPYLNWIKRVRATATIPEKHVEA